MTRLSAYERLKGKDQPVHDGDAFSRKHPKMDRVKRAKIFQPFDALRGFSAEVDIALDDTMLVEAKELDEGEIERINKQLSRLALLCKDSADLPEASIVYFEKKKENAAHKPAGIYEASSGRITRVDEKGKCLFVGDKRIAFADITDIVLL